jgi:hypothetical protein
MESWGSGADTNMHRVMWAERAKIGTRDTLEARSASHRYGVDDAVGDAADLRVSKRRRADGVVARSHWGEERKVFCKRKGDFVVDF